MSLKPLNRVEGVDWVGLTPGRVGSSGGLL